MADQETTDMRVQNYRARAKSAREMAASVSSSSARHLLLIIADEWSQKADNAVASPQVTSPGLGRSQPSP